ncbi:MULTISPECIES: DUF5919 domain-containing protein [Micromonospora]|uniref:DUF5919 domain-containing protein n=2 Tax=Micromonospora TaxID=1873 RepID=A0A1C4ZRT2_9ACTN|nr:MULTISPECIES: DUF5919 domain-containing protein [Micromonospora]KAB1927044.1 hypothetical protein F8280_08845 [Micromonospora noduli]RAN96602.1 hypothetical protein LAH08_05345 [Micromonospora noduli]RAO05310.1 hypothetical protein GAR05_00352 [Micromonospora saelicesensis]RAO13776.1 hypothetical protein LUPAC07_04068 [Micromonospora noduli]RAO16566.1 hypothetical protein GUI43_01462 [Micromonospora noduli]
MPGWAGRGGRQRRAFVVGGALFAIAVVMLLAAWRSTGFLSDLLLNLGASVVLAAISYVIFDPLFEEARKARVQEHLSFDQQAFVTRLHRSGRRVRILDTWTILLEQRHREDTLSAVRAALANGAQVQLLLLDPDCTAAQQRSEELERQRVDVPRQIRTNLRHLAAFAEALDSRLRHRLQVRLYDASPSIQLYQWDGRALISFFPIGKLSFNVPQLEVDMDSPWGGFVHARFEELWEHEQATLDLERYWSVTVTLRHDESDVVEVRVPFVTVDGQHYVDCRGFRVTGPLTVRAVLPPRAPGAAPGVFALAEPADGDRTPVAVVKRHFDQKYGHDDGERDVRRLVPPPGDARTPAPRPATAGDTHAR